MKVRFLLSLVFAVAAMIGARLLLGIGPSLSEVVLVVLVTMGCNIIQGNLR